MIFAGLKASFIGKFNNRDKVQKMVVIKHCMESQLNLYNFYAYDLWPFSDEEPFHAEIVKMFKLDPKAVLGGCRVRRASDEEVVLYGGSGAYGSIPKAFLDCFNRSILNEYQQDFPEVKKVTIDVPFESSNDNKISFLAAFAK